MRCIYGTGNALKALQPLARSFEVPTFGLKAWFGMVLIAPKLYFDCFHCVLHACLPHELCTHAINLHIQVTLQRSGVKAPRGREQFLLGKDKSLWNLLHV